jgi:hypothetical protein
MVLFNQAMVLRHPASATGSACTQLGSMRVMLPYLGTLDHHRNFIDHSGTRTGLPSSRAPLVWSKFWGLILFDHTQIHDSRVSRIVLSQPHARPGPCPSLGPTFPGKNSRVLAPPRRQ